MNLKQQLTNLKEALAQTESVVIFLPENASYDQIAAGLSLYLGLIKLGKLATIASSTPTKVKDADLVGIDKIKNELNGKNLIVSLPYEEGNIEKVSYNFDGGKFNLVIEPKSSQIKINREEVDFSTGGTEADLVLTVGVNRLESIGFLYKSNVNLFNSKDLVNIDNQQTNTNYGKINIVNIQLPSISEIVVLVLKNLAVMFDSDIATNLYKGMQKATNNFDPNIVSALTFEAAALCLRSGAQRQTSQQIQASTASQIIHPQKTIHPQQPQSKAKKEPQIDWLKPKIFSPNSNGANS